MTLHVKFWTRCIINWFWAGPLRPDTVYVRYLMTQSWATVTCHQQRLPLTCGVPSVCLGTRSQETTSRDHRGKIEMFFSSTGACTVAKSPIANHHGHITAQLCSASITQIFRMRLFVKVEYVSSKLLTTASKSAPNGCKECSRPQKMLMRIKIDGLLGR